MGMVFCEDARTAVPRLTGGQYFLEVDDTGVYFIQALTGERLQLLKPEGPPAVAKTVPAMDERFEPVSRLSKRERQILTLLGDGIEMSEIADQLRLSVKTVETYRARIKTKLNIKARLGLVAYAVEWKLMSRAMRTATVTPNPWRILSAVPSLFSRKRPH